MCGMSDDMQTASMAGLLRAVDAYGVACAQYGSESGAYDTKWKRRRAYSDVLDLAEVVALQQGVSWAEVSALAWHGRRGSR
jgi:hypothetical protein